MLENNFLLFTIPIVSVVGLLVVYMTWKTNGKIREYLNTKGKMVMFGLTVAVVAPAAVALVLTAIAYGEKAHGAEWRYLDHSIIMAGLEVPAFTNSPVCVEDGINDRLTSNLSFYQQLAGREDVDIYAHYIHHSCAINMDKPTYDAFGFNVQWRINWNRK